MKPLESLRQLLERTSNEPRSSCSDVLAMLVYVRQLLESDELKPEYLLTNFYCNWVVHPEIMQSRVGYRILEQLSVDFSRALGLHGSDQENRDPTRVAIATAENILSIPGLRAELISLFNRYRLPLFLFNIKSNWDQIFGVVLKEVCDKSVRFSDEDSMRRNKERYKDALKCFKKIQRESGGYERAMIITLSVIKDEPAFPGKYCWSLKTATNVKYIGQIMGNEPPEAFSGPSVEESDEKNETESAAET